MAGFPACHCSCPFAAVICNTAIGPPSVYNINCAGSGLSCLSCAETLIGSFKQTNKQTNKQQVSLYPREGKCPPWKAPPPTNSTHIKLLHLLKLHDLWGWDDLLSRTIKTQTNRIQISQEMLQKYFELKGGWLNDDSQQTMMNVKCLKITNAHQTMSEDAGQFPPGQARPVLPSAECNWQHSTHLHFLTEKKYILEREPYFAHLAFSWFWHPCKCIFSTPWIGIHKRE